MSLIKNKENDNFYPVSIPEVDWQCDYLWSTHRGCSFDCTYCSSKRWFNHYHKNDPEWNPAMPRRLGGEWSVVEPDCGYLKKWILPNTSVFISPYNDIMNIPENDIRSILGKIYDSSEYWFDRDAIGHKGKSEFKIIMQTKDTAKYFDYYLDLIPEGSWLGTTIETDSALYQEQGYSKAPKPEDRFRAMLSIPDSFRKFITIEPIMKLHDSMIKELLYPKLVYWLADIKPDLIFIGCDTGKNNLPEPSRDELVILIEQLKEITTVHVKNNCGRILGNMRLYNTFEELKKM